MPNPNVSQLRKALNKQILDLAIPVGKGILKGRKATPPGLQKFGSPPRLTPNPVAGLITTPTPAQTPSGLLMQPVIPNKIWDWQDPGPGKISEDLFEFCDHIPASSDPDANYSASANSFSQNYTSFLEVISPEFAPQSLLQGAKASAARPLIPPSDVTGPLGWVLVKNRSGFDRWQPNWIVDSTPMEFLAQNQADANPSTLNLGDAPMLKSAIREGLNLICYGEAEGQLTAPKVIPGDIQDIQITAGSWGRVSIYPGDWYNSSLMILAGQGPFVGKFSPQTIFGPKGLLPCRISEMIVAAGLNAKITLSQDFMSRQGDNILGAKHLELLGFNLETNKNSQNPSPLKLSTQGNTAILSVLSSSQSPAIIGVVIEDFIPIQND